MKFILLALTLAASALASDLAKRPRPIAINGEQAVFADFTKAHFDITYDFAAKQAIVDATIELTTAERGLIIFDAPEIPSNVTLNNEVHGTQLVSLVNTKFHVLTKPNDAGNHVLKLRAPIKQLVEFSGNGVKSAFWMTDLTDRGYLERYLPTNFIFDRIPTTFLVKFVGAEAQQRVYANGEIEKLSNNEYRITYPEGYNATCFYFHTTPVSAMDEVRFNLKSVDGRELPAVVYLTAGPDSASRLNDFKNRVTSIFNNLEADFGAFPHPSLTVYIAGSGGMEYSGATMTSPSALSHELFHSYYARAVMPSDGNSGWIDEALASWRDGGFGSQATLSGSTRMGALGEYNRVTDTQAYGFGARFMGLLHHKTQDKGGLKPFLKETVEKKAFEPLNNAEFIQLMDNYFGMSFSADFNKYIMGRGEKMQLKPAELHPIHRQMSLKELQSLL